MLPPTNRLLLGFENVLRDEHGDPQDWRTDMLIAWDQLRLAVQSMEREAQRSRLWTPKEFEEAQEWCDQAISKAKDGLLTQNEMRITNNLVHALDSLRKTREELFNEKATNESLQMTLKRNKETRL